MAAHQLDEFLTNGNIKNSVNYPSVSIPHSAAARVCIMHKNVPDVLNSITSVISAEGLNIENLSNGSKGDYAYTIVELSSAPSEKSLDAFRALESVIKVKSFA